MQSTKSGRHKSPAFALVGVRRFLSFSRRMGKERVASPAASCGGGAVGRIDFYGSRPHMRPGILLAVVGPLKL